MLGYSQTQKFLDALETYCYKQQTVTLPVNGVGVEEAGREGRVSLDVNKKNRNLESLLLKLLAALFSFSLRAAVTVRFIVFIPRRRNTA